MIRRFLLLCFIFLPVFCCQAADQIVLYNMGDKDSPDLGLLKKYLETKRYSLNLFNKATTLEKHLENVNKINKTNAQLMLAMDFRLGEKNDVLVAITNAKRGSGKILTIEEVPAQHLEQSTDLAKAVAVAFGKNVKSLPLFPFLGVDMPGIFLEMECTKDRMEDMLNILNDCLQKYLTRGVKNEG